MVMSMVSVLLLADGVLAELDVGDVAGENDALGLLASAGLAAAWGSALLVHPASKRPKVAAPLINAPFASPALTRIKSSPVP